MSTSGPWVSASPVVRPGDIWNTRLDLPAEVHSGTFTLPGGGSLTANETTRRLASVLQSGGGLLAGSGIKHATAMASISGGGAPSGTISHGAFGGFAASGGGQINATVVVPILLRGGGYLYGPYPYVLTPRLRVVNGQSAILVRTAQSGVKVNTVSVRTTVHT